MLKTFKRVLSAILTVAIVFFPLFDSYANGANIEELTETVDKDALSRAMG